MLRARPGDELRVGVVRAGSGTARVVAVSDDAIVLELAIESAPAAPPPLELVLAVPRPKVLSRALEIAASFGVARIDLVNAWRVDRSYFSSPKLAPDAIDEALWRGCEQGGTTWIPECAVHPLLVPFLDEAAGGWGHGCDRLLAHPRAEHSVEVGWSRTPNLRTVLAIGPEGGWIQDEIESFVRIGFRAVSFGPQILRVEAAIAALLGQLELLRRLPPAVLHPER